MANVTSSHSWLFRHPRRLAISAIGGIVAVLVIAGTLTLTTLNLSHVHASGTGGGGCYPTSGPACTFKGHSGYAEFQSSSDCVFTDINVFASDNFSRSSGSTTSTSDINLSMNSYNNCTGDYSYGWGYDTGTVQFSQGGSTLNAQGNITVYIFTGNDSGSGGTSAGLAGSGIGGGGGSTSTATYTVNLTWKSFGTPTRQVSTFHYQSPGFITDGHFTGTSQNAIVSGTLSDGTTNFAATPSIYGESIGADSGTLVTIQK